MGLMPGDYTITETQPTGYFDGLDTAGTQGGTAGDDTITMSLDNHGPPIAEEYNFGELGGNPAVIGKTPFFASGAGSGGQATTGPVTAPQSGNPTAITSGTLVVSGTGENNVIFVALGRQEHRVVVDYVEYVYRTSEVETILVDGQGGRDQITVLGSTLSDNFVMRPDYLRATSARYDLKTKDIEIIRVEGGGGVDRVTLQDSSGDDQLLARPEYAALTGDNVRLFANDVDNITVSSRNGGNDVADVRGGTGADKYVGRPDSGTISGVGYETRMLDFETIEVIASTGNDHAVLFDSAGNDRFEATPKLASLVGPGYSHTVAMSNVRVVSDAGGVDHAYLAGSTGDDLYIGRPDSGVLRAVDRSYQTTVQNFDVIEVEGSRGNDSARFYDSEGDDRLVASPEVVTMRGITDKYQHQLTSFEHIVANASGGRDTAVITDTLGDDQFQSTSTSATLRGQDNEYVVVARSFDDLRVTSTGGEDTAVWQNVVSSETVFARGEMSRISGGSRTHRVDGFEQVTARTADGETARAVVSNVDFLFSEVGDWI